jgi:nucleoside-diphosphate-sugar epimerase
MLQDLVTGGNVGNYVAEELASKGFSVRVFVPTIKTNPNG